mmetsp:Transcript_7521/g.17759  ORF Transcript_7521/g.17759 Transcript_7521/m.17759 type:complete len:479 (-) Transcript_7521:3653-5089(-)
MLVTVPRISADLETLRAEIGPAHAGHCGARVVVHERYAALRTAQGEDSLHDMKTMGLHVVGSRCLGLGASHSHVRNNRAVRRGRAMQAIRLLAQLAMSFTACLSQHLIARRPRALDCIFGCPQKLPQRTLLNHGQLRARSRHVLPRQLSAARPFLALHRAPEWDTLLFRVAKIPPDTVAAKLMATLAQLHHLIIKVVLAQETLPGTPSSAGLPPPRNEFPIDTAEHVVGRPDNQNAPSHISLHRSKSHHGRPHCFDCCLSGLQPLRLGLQNVAPQHETLTRLRFHGGHNAVQRRNGGLAFLRTAINPQGLCADVFHHGTRPGPRLSALDTKPGEQQGSLIVLIAVAAEQIEQKIAKVPDRVIRALDCQHNFSVGRLRDNGDSLRHPLLNDAQHCISWCRRQRCRVAVPAPRVQEPAILSVAPGLEPAPPPLPSGMPVQAVQKPAPSPAPTLAVEMLCSLGRGGHHGAELGFRRDTMLF